MQPLHLAWLQGSAPLAHPTRQLAEAGSGTMADPVGAPQVALQAHQPAAQSAATCIGCRNEAHGVSMHLQVVIASLPFTSDTSSVSAPGATPYDGCLNATTLMPSAGVASSSLISRFTPKQQPSPFRRASACHMLLIGGEGPLGYTGAQPGR